ncbi:Serine/threonine-protein kinase StkP [Candidatus Brocadiaceae bacterium B188]|nr:serine/threonine protein kinase [Candidatus Brocadia sapporoensis]QQR66035.1 MAG: serine/threonine protein kinase [Candidatus Brocadia sp.]TWU52944.1 Serine/threonine-protein kinase StkP [Candidatus Brocadiaceae bacterium B188]
MQVSLYLNHKRDEIFYIKDAIKSISDNQYDIQERIASGGNAVVHKCVNSSTGDEYAIKFQLTLTENRIKRFKQEISLLKQVEHNHLIKYVDNGEVNSIVKYKGKKNEIIKNILFLIMPIADFNLSQYIQKSQNKISYADYIAQFKGLVSALAVLHQKAIHRDIKPENILIKGETWLLSDFGLCKFFDDNCLDITHENEPVGPRYWMSPEAVNRSIGNNDEISIKSDIFQLCSIFWFVVTGRHPSGVVSKKDWNGPDSIFEPIFNSLYHDPNERPIDANKLVELLHESTLRIPYANELD